MRYTVISYVWDSLISNALKIFIDFDLVEPFIASLKGFVTYDLKTALDALEVINKAISSILEKLSEASLVKWASFSDEAKSIQEIILENKIDEEDLNILLVYPSFNINATKAAKVISLYFVSKGIPSKLIKLDLSINDMDQRIRGFIREYTSILKGQLNKGRTIILNASGAPEPERTIIKMLGGVYSLDVYDLVDGKIINYRYPSISVDIDFIRSNVEIFSKLVNPIKESKAKTIIGDKFDKVKGFLMTIEMMGERYLALNYPTLIFYYKFVE